MWILVYLLILIIFPVDTISFTFFPRRECVKGVSCFYEFLWHSPQSSQVCSCRKCSCPSLFPPSPSAVWQAAQSSWLGCSGHSGIAAQSIPAMPQQGALGWGAEPASPPGFTGPHSGLCSHFCEYPGIFLVYSTNKTILFLILTLQVLQPGQATPGNWGLSFSRAVASRNFQLLQCRVQPTIWPVRDDRKAHFSELAQNWQPGILEFSV